MKTLRILSLGLFLVSTSLVAAAGCSGSTITIGADDGGSGKASCTVGGTTYAHGQSFPSADGCNTCSCDNGAALCTERACASDGGAGSCTYGGKTYADGATFPSTDGCNSCGCSAGQVACTARACADAGGGCDYHGATYSIGETFKSIDGCNDCTCTAQGVACTKRACLDAGPDAGYKCPPAGTYDCMPIVPPQNREVCAQPYRAWVQQNCPGVKYVD